MLAVAFKTTKVHGPTRCQFISRSFIVGCETRNVLIDTTFLYVNDTSFVLFRVKRKEKEILQRNYLWDLTCLFGICVCLLDLLDFSKWPVSIFVNIIFSMNIYFVFISFYYEKERFVPFFLLRNYKNVHINYLWYLACIFRHTCSHIRFFKTIGKQSWIRWFISFFF